MPVTIDKLLGRPLLHTHQMSDIVFATSGNIDVTSVVTVTTDTTLSDYTTVLVNAASAPVTITLPAAALSTNKIYRVKKIDATANIVIVEGNGAETIDGDLNITIAFQNSSMDIVSNGTSWYII